MRVSLVIGQLVLLLSLEGVSARAAGPPPELVPLPSRVVAPRDNPTTPDKVALGKRLFFDPRLSGDNSISCASCHDPQHAFADGQPRSRGANGKPLARNTPTCLDAGFWKTLTWDGRAGSLEEQAKGPITSAAEMNQNPADLAREIADIRAYRQEFERVFGGPPTMLRITQALAAFQRTLVAKSSPFDRFLAGDRSALSEKARRGLELFRGDAGCVECHHGPLLSDEKFYRLGVSFQDEGRAAVTGDPADRFRFRTPTLRNVADTAPYMHDGSLKTLDEVVMFYFREIPDIAPDGLEMDLSARNDQSISDIPALVAFLQSLSGAIPEVPPPLLPELLPDDPNTWISPASRSNQGWFTHRVRSPYQKGETMVRVLVPRQGVTPKTPVVLVLPVEQQGSHRFGDGMAEIAKHDLHNRFQALFVEPSFSDLPWYANHPSDATIRQESYMVRVVIPLVRRFYRVSRRSSDWHLLGYSKSGWGAWSLLLRHPQSFGKAAAWDAPLAMKSIGKYGNRPIFGSQANFEQYRIADLLTRHRDAFTGSPRLLLTGFGNFRDHHLEVHQWLEQHGVAHDYWDGPRREHDWHSGWVAPAVEWLLSRSDTDDRDSPAPR